MYLLYVSKISDTHGGYRCLFLNLRHDFSSSSVGLWEGDPNLLTQRSWLKVKVEKVCKYITMMTWFEKKNDMIVVKNTEFLSSQDFNFTLNKISYVSSKTCVYQY